MADRDDDKAKETPSDSKQQPSSEHQPTNGASTARNKCAKCGRLARKGRLFWLTLSILAVLLSMSNHIISSTKYQFSRHLTFTFLLHRLHPVRLLKLLYRPRVWSPQRSSWTSALEGASVGRNHCDSTASGVEAQSPVATPLANQTRRTSLLLCGRYRRHLEFSWIYGKPKVERRCLAESEQTKSTRSGNCRNGTIGDQSQAVSTNHGGVVSEESCSAMILIYVWSTGWTKKAETLKFLL